MQKKADLAETCVIFVGETRETTPMDDMRGSAPDFTTACIVMFGVNIAWIFFAIWAIWGLVAVAGTGWCINRLISYVEVRRAG